MSVVMATQHHPNGSIIITKVILRTFRTYRVVIKIVIIKYSILNARFTVFGFIRIFSIHGPQKMFGSYG